MSIVGLIAKSRLVAACHEIEYPRTSVSEGILYFYPISILHLLKSQPMDKILGDEAIFRKVYN